MKQGELAERLHISTSYLSEIENGKKAPSLGLLEEYSKVFKVPASTFLLFKERAEGGVDAKVSVHAERLLKFFEWVIDDESGSGTTEEVQKKAGKS